MAAYNADYKLDHHAGLLISILRRGINSDIIDFVENCHPQLLDERNYIDWKTAVIKAEATLSERTRRKGARKAWRGASGQRQWKLERWR